MILVKGQKVRITFLNSPYFMDNGKIGTFVGMSGTFYLIYIEGSMKNKNDSRNENGDAYTWVMDLTHFKVLGQVQLEFAFMYEDESQTIGKGGLTE